MIEIPDNTEALIRAALEPIYTCNREHKKLIDTPDLDLVETLKRKLPVQLGVLTHKWSGTDLLVSAVEVEKVGDSVFFVVRSRTESAIHEVRRIEIPPQLGEALSAKVLHSENPYHEWDVYAMDIAEWSWTVQKCLEGLLASIAIQRDMNNVKSTSCSPPAWLQAMTNLSWREVELAFVADNWVRVTVRGNSDKFNFERMGFRDGRKKDLPDSRWAILRDLAEHREFSHRTTFVPKARMAMSEIRTRLTAFFRIDDDPIPYSNREKAYRPAFRLVDDRPTLYRGHHS